MRNATCLKYTKQQCYHAFWYPWITLDVNAFGVINKFGFMWMKSPFFLSIPCCLLSKRCQWNVLHLSSILSLLSFRVRDFLCTCLYHNTCKMSSYQPWNRGDKFVVYSIHFPEKRTVKVMDSRTFSSIHYTCAHEWKAYSMKNTMEVKSGHTT